MLFVLSGDGGEGGGGGRGSKEEGFGGDGGVGELRDGVVVRCRGVRVGEARVERDLFGALVRVGLSVVRVGKKVAGEGRGRSGGVLLLLLVRLELTRTVVGVAVDERVSRIGSGVRREGDGRAKGRSSSSFLVPRFRMRRRVDDPPPLPSQRRHRSTPSPPLLALPLLLVLLFLPPLHVPLIDAPIILRRSTIPFGAVLARPATLRVERTSTAFFFRLWAVGVCESGER